MRGSVIRNQGGFPSPGTRPIRGRPTPTFPTPARAAAPILDTCDHELAATSPRVKILIAVAALLAALAIPSVAAAVPPAFTSIGHQNRHLTATFSAPRADSVTIYVATKPNRATDGSFLSENVETLDSFADSEIQQGRWLSEAQIDPGTYYVMLRASADFGSCYVFETGGYDPACADGYSEVVRLVVPKPAIRYSTTTQLLGFSQKLYLTLKATPLGENQSYRVCYRTALKKRRCVSGRIDGYSWNSAASDELSISTRGLTKTTTFQWFVGTRLVAQRTARVR